MKILIALSVLFLQCHLHAEVESIEVPILGEITFAASKDQLEVFRQKGLDAGKMTLDVARSIKLHDIEISSPKLIVSPRGFPELFLGPGYEIVGNATVFGSAIKAHIYLTLPAHYLTGDPKGAEAKALAKKGAPPKAKPLPAKKERTALFTLRFEGEFISKEQFRPFKDTNLSVLKSISMRDPRVIIEKSPEGSYAAVQGTVDALGVTFKATAGVPAGKKGIILKGTLPETWQPPGPFSGLRIKNPTAILSSIEYTDRDLRQFVRAGLGFTGALSMDSPMLSNVKRFLKKAVGDIIIYGNIGKPRDMVIRGALPITLDFPSRKGAKPFRGAAVYLEVTGSPSIALVLTLYVQPTPKDEELAFSARLKFQLHQALLAGTMSGIWKAPLGFKGLEMGDMAIQAAPSYAAGWPSELGLIGTLKVGSKKVQMGINAAADVRNIGAIGSINELGLQDIAALARSIGAKVVADKMPRFDYKDVSVRFAPLGARIGEIYIDPGITMKGTLEIGDQKGGVDINVDLSGIKVKGFMPTIKFPGLTITGAGLDGIKGTADDGPAVDLALSLREQHYKLTGEVSLLGIRRATDIEISKERMYFKVSGALFNLYEITLECEGRGGLKHPNFIAAGTLGSDFIGDLEVRIRSLLKKHTGHKTFAFTFNVRKASLRADLSKIAAGNSPEVILDYTYRGVHKTITLSYNFKEPAEHIAGLVKKLVVMPIVAKVKGAGQAAVRKGKKAARGLKKKWEEFRD